MVSGLFKGGGHTPGHTNISSGRVPVWMAVIMSCISFLIGRRTVQPPPGRAAPILMETKETPSTSTPSHSLQHQHHHATLNNNSTATTMTTMMQTQSQQTAHNEHANNHNSQPIPQVFNFIKELQCRQGHMSIPPLLNVTKSQGLNKVVVDIGLDAGDEFFAALASGYSVYGIEANPLTIASGLRAKCESATAYKCVYVNAETITEPLPPIANGGYLIEGGAGSARGTMNMSLSGPGSSFVEVAPGVEAPTYKSVTVLPVSEIVQADVFFFKLDVQGYEFEVLKGSKDLFDKYVVKTLLMEVYPRGLGHADTNFYDFLSFIWNDLGMMCSSANPESDKTFKTDHPGSLPEFAKYLEGMTDTFWWGVFDDFYCFNWKKTWNHG